MKIRIIKTNKDSVWYADKIGVVFDVAKEFSDFYAVKSTGGRVIKEDCEIFPE